MEPIPAAQAMKWCIELDKGLRSKKPGRAVEAILCMGPRLVRWSQESNIPASMAHMFGLVLGEDRAFANAIILRLADAFMSGDKFIKASVLKVLLMEMKSRRRRGSRYDGILAKKRVPNHMEVLRRIKVVFDKGDVESRALALRVIGCLADFGKDSAEIRYMVVSTLLESSHVMELKASLFAAGHICELSEGFAFVVLEMVVSLLTSKRACYAVKRAVTLVFAKMGSSYAIACRAYETGKKLTMDSQNAEIVADILLALTKLASKSSVLISDQIFRFSLPSLDQSIVVDLIKVVEIAARSHNLAVKHVAFGLLVDLAFCIRKIIPETRCDKFDECLIMSKCYQTNPQSTSPLSGENNLQILPCRLTLLIMDEITLLCEKGAAEIKSGVAICGSKEELHGELEQEFQYLLGLVRVLMKEYPMVSHLALCRVKGLIETLVGAQGKLNGDSVVISKETSKGYDNQENSQLSSGQVPTIEGRMLDSSIASLLFLLCRFACTCLDFLDAADAIDANISDTVSLLMECVWKDNFSHNSGTCMILSFFLHFHVKLNLLKKPNQNSTFSRHECLKQNSQNSSSYSDGAIYEYDQVDGQSQVQSSKGASLRTRLKVGVLSSRQEGPEGFNQPESCQCLVGDGGKRTGGLTETNHENDCLKNYNDSFWVKHECFTLDFAKEMIRNKEFWIVYKIGKYAATKGAWFATSFIFSQLLCLGGVQSDSCYCWLRTVSDFACAENELHSLFFDEKTIQLLDWVKINDDGKFSRIFAMEATDFCSKVPNMQEYGIKVAEVHRKICLAEVMLSTAATLEPTFYFQRWFLKLRAKTLEYLSDMLGMLELFTCDKRSVRNEEHAEKNVRMSFHNPQILNALTFQLTHVSFQFRSLAKEFDLLAMSFMDIDMESFRYISILALNCSLLAFCAAFVVFFPELPDNEFDMLSSRSSRKQLHAKLVQDLAERLRHADTEISEELFLFLRTFGNRFFLPSGTQFFSYDYVLGESLEICRFAIPRVLRLQKGAVGENSNIDRVDPVMTGVVHLSEVLGRWIHLPFHIPSFFFRTRRCIGAEIFSNSGSKDFVQSTVQGCWLHLNLCVQMKNLPPKMHTGIMKMYCIVAARPSDCLVDAEDVKQVSVGFRAWETEEMMNLNEELLRYMRREASARTAETVEGLEKSGFVKSFASSRPNENMQGFSTCMLDVSAFPVGTYQCSWHSCCVDSNGRCWSLLPLNSGPIFTVKKT
ncbi:Integrator complex subunit 7-like protein [Nymphaea thermarum]|nr:Integrator complex subunit 7-like protein [Nymphaea thermarum]